VSAEAGGSLLATKYTDHHVTGTGPNAYLQWSGTSMAAGVVSGAVAVLLEERPALAPRDTKVALQVTSSFMPSFGLIGAGAGSLNVLAATQLVGPANLAPTNISNEKVIAGGVGFWDQAAGESADSVIWGASPIPGHSVIWGSAVIWGDAVIWGSSVIWGNAVVGSAVDASNKTVIWGSTATVIWGSSWADTDTFFD